MKKRFFLLFGNVFYVLSLFSQNGSFKNFIYNAEFSDLKFSVNIPSSWKAIPLVEGSGYFQTFIETDSLKTPIKKLCLDSVIFNFKYFSTPIPEAMEAMGFRNQSNNIFSYNLNNYIHIVVGFEIKNSNCKGLSCSFKTKLPCEGKKSKIKNAEMQYLFFSDGVKTICILNNGIPLSNLAITEIEKTFKFD